MEMREVLDTAQLFKLLGSALVKEQEHWKPVQYKSSGNPTAIGGINRDEVVGWIVSQNSRFHFSQETVAISIALLDRFVSRINVRPKYIYCVAISCFYIAAKTQEEDEVIPSTVDLVRTSQCGFSVAEILRMEGAILNKLNWDLRVITPLRCLHIIHGLLMNHFPTLLDGAVNLTRSRLSNILSRNMFHCLSNHKMVKFRPVTLALAVTSLELEQLTPNWLSIISYVQQTAEIEIATLIQCREIAAQILRQRNMLPTGYQFTSTAPTASKPPKSVSRRSPQRSKSIKRKVEAVELEDDVYDGIKRLYSEETSPTPGLIKSCGSEVTAGLDSEAASSSYVQQVQPVSAN